MCISADFNILCELPNKSIISANMYTFVYSDRVPGCRRANSHFAAGHPAAGRIVIRNLAAGHIVPPVRLHAHY
jgi:hypothetical protein